MVDLKQVNDCLASCGINRTSEEEISKAFAKFPKHAQVISIVMETLIVSESEKEAIKLLMDMGFQLGLFTGVDLKKEADI